MAVKFNHNSFYCVLCALRVGTRVVLLIVSNCKAFSAGLLRDAAPTLYENYLLHTLRKYTRVQCTNSKVCVVDKICDYLAAEMLHDASRV